MTKNVESSQKTTLRTAGHGRKLWANPGANFDLAAKP
jgi:hypothetical protein